MSAPAHVETNLTASQVLRAIAMITFREFTQNDWYAYAGCEIANPMIGVYGPYVVILDGDQINVCHEHDQHGGQSLSLLKN